MEWIGWIWDDGQAGFRLRKEIGSCLGSLSCRQQTGSRGGRRKDSRRKKNAGKKRWEGATAARHGWQLAVGRDTEGYVPKVPI